MTVFISEFKVRSKTLFFLLLLIFANQIDLRGQDCVCTNCPQFMPDNFVGDFLINVMGADNNQLGQNGQGVCGVNIVFDHEYVGDLSIVLTSPSGQSVTLIGPIGLFGMTDFTSWAVSFVPCNDPATPDPGFSAQWNNNQPWGLFGNYNGSYYPATGCLENFNSGPVNGTWTLTVTDGQANDVGNFYNYEIIFCDPSGILCFTCAADAGDLTQTDITACQGSSDLALNLPPTYNAPAAPPPAGEYSYTYVIGGAGGVILAYEDDPNLSGYDVGVYTVCGFSYYSTQVGEIPQPDGSLTIMQLSNQLSSSNPPLCGNISGNCVNVTINENPPDEDETITVCAPNCYFFHGQNYCQSGIYVVNLVSPEGCDYTATLNLSVLQPSINNVNETVCVGECSSTPGFEIYCDPGNYQEILMNSAGCDSIVNLNLQVLDVVAAINPPGELSCTQSSLQLLGLGSSTGALVNYLWTASNGGHIQGINTAINVLVDAPGDYQLRVCKTGAGISCCDSISVTVLASQDPPAAPAAVTGPVSICQGDDLSFTASAVIGATSYFWTVPPGVTINSGQDSSTINVTWDSASGGDICAAAINLCDTSALTCLAVGITPILVPAPPSGNNLVCAGSTEMYFVQSLAGVTSYNWTTTGGATIVSGQGTDTIMINWGATNGSVCVNASSACGQSPNVCLPVSIVNIPAVPLIMGSDTTCPGLSAAYSVATVPGASTYNWQVSNGLITMGQGTNTIQVLWDSTAMNGAICVNAGNSCGNSADSCLNVSLSIPLAGQASYSCDSSNQYYTVSFPITGGTAPYSIPGGTILNGIFTSDTILGGQPYSFEITDANTCVSAVISGSFNCNCSTNAGNMSLMPLSACEGDTISAIHLGNETLDGNDIGIFILHSNSGTSLGTIFAQDSAGNFGLSAGMVYDSTYYISYVVGNNFAGIPDLSDPCLSVSNGQPVVFHLNPQSSNLLQTCDPINENYTVSFQITGGTPNYSVSGSPTGTTMGNNFTSDLIPNGGNYSFVISDNFGCASPAITGTFNCNCASAAGNMDLGLLSACEGDSIAALYLGGENLDGNDVGAFFLHTGAGNTLDTILDANISGVFSFLPGMFYGTTYYISYVVGNNLNGLPDTSDLCLSVSIGQPVVFNQNPVLVDVVRTCDSTNTNYTVSLTLSGGTAPYAVNASPVAGATFTSNPMASGQNYVFNVQDANGCAMPPITGAFSCNCATDAGTMALPTIYRCAGQSITVIANNDQTLDGNDVVAYVLHDGAGSVLGQIFAQNTTGVFTLQNGMVEGQNYYVSLVAGNPLGNFPDPADPCFSVASGQPVVWLPYPVPNAGIDASICGETIALQADSSGYVGVWTNVLGPGMANFFTPSDPSSGVNVTDNGTYVFQWTEMNGACIASDQVIIDFNPIPDISGLIETCNGTNTEFSLAFTVNNGTPPFSINGLSGTFSGSTFNSLPIVNNGSYTFAVTDANGCTTTDISGTYYCACSTDAGTMQVAPAVFCANDPATGVWDNNANLDADDIVLFVLHDSSGSTLGNVFATNNQASFSFGGNLQTGITYYISAVAGSNMGGSIDFSDACLSVAPGVPVQWKPMPTATLSGDAVLCSGDVANLSFSGSGSWPLTVGYLEGANSATIVLPDAQTVQLNVTPSNTTIYTLISVADGTAPTCSSLLNGNVTLTVNQPVDAGIASAPFEFCAGVDTSLVLADAITGADQGGLWIETSVTPSMDGGFNAVTGSFSTSGQAPGTYTFQYLLSAVAPCSSDSETVTITIHPTPIADAGQIQTIDCDQTSVVLGGNATTQGNYSWTLNGNIVGDTKELVVSEAGTYRLLVSNAAGCTDEDETMVLLDNQAPIAESITINGVRCFGDINGSISIDSVSAAHLPILYALNDLPFQLNPYFPGLEPGNYIITLMDANGCMSTTAQLIVSQPLELLSDLGDDIEATLGDSVSLFVETGVPLTALDTIIWQPLLDSSATRLPNEQHILPVQSWRVNVTVIDSNGCIGYDELLIRLEKPRNIFIPNVFNPASSIDPVFYISGGSDVMSIESFLIFDRWGTLVFEQKDFSPNDPANGWDGMFRGDLLNPGVFVYQVKVKFIDGQVMLYKGDLTLVR